MLHFLFHALHETAFWSEQAAYKTMLFRTHSKHRSSFEVDESSVSSTITVEGAADKEVSSRPLSSTKNVSFDLTFNKEYSNDMMYKEDCQDFWYTLADHRHFKKCNSFMSKEIAKAESKNKAPYSYQKVMLRTYEACSRATDEPDGSVLDYFEWKPLVCWAEVATSRLGLEKWSVRSIGKDRNFRRAEIVELVLDLQDVYVKDSKEREEFIRSSCENISRTSRLFAQVMAEAQAAAAMVQHDDLSE